MHILNTLSFPPAGCQFLSLRGSWAGLHVGLSLIHPQHWLGSSQQLPNTGHDGCGLKKGSSHHSGDQTGTWWKTHWRVLRPDRGVFSPCWQWHWVGRLAQSGGNNDNQNTPELRKTRATEAVWAHAESWILHVGFQPALWGFFFLNRCN